MSPIGFRIIRFSASGSTLSDSPPVYQIESRARPLMGGRPLIAVLLAFAMLLLLPTGAAKADYTPNSVWYYSNYGISVGPNGTWMLASSSLPSSYMALSDASRHFSARTGFSRVLVPTGTTDCGNTQGCVLFDKHQTSLDWAPSCTVPTLASGVWAATYVSSGSIDNSGCAGIGSNYAPVWIVPVNVNNVQNDWYGYQHMVRHEVTHALGLDDTSTTCYTQSGVTGYLPLMNNGPCSGPYRNFYLTNNEVSGIISRNGWN